MTLTHRSRAALSVVLATLVAGGTAAHAAHAAGSTATEAETFTRASTASRVVTDATASGGAHLAFTSNGSAAGTVPVTAAGTLVVRARGDQYLGAPVVRVAVDGVSVADVSVPATSWTDYVVPGSVAAGTHTVTLTFTNDRYDATTGGDRNLRVDLVRVDPPAAPTTGLDAAYEARIVTLVNAERAKVGLAPLAVSACAQGFAEPWSTQMATTGVFAHQSLSPIMTTCRSTAAGENIAYGNVTAEEMMTMWMNSAGHKANILNATYTHIGVGAYRTSTGRVYGTQDFLRL